jgi:hypothetical protein
LLLARLGQSPVVGYLLAGVLIGPHGLGLLRAVGEVRSMADLGVALLLFSAPPPPAWGWAKVCVEPPGGTTPSLASEDAAD